MTVRPTPGERVLYRTDGRNGLVYDLPAIVTVTAASHPGGYPDGEHNPLPVPGEPLTPHPMYAHLTVLAPGGYGSRPATDDPVGDDTDYVGARSLTPGSGTYVEWSVPHAGAEFDGIPADVDHERHGDVPPRTWRWPAMPDTGWQDRTGDG